MKIAVHTPWSPARPIAEAEQYQRMAIAAGRLGWTCRRTDNTREIEEFAPDLVLAEHFSVAKLTSYPTLGLMWNPPAFWSEHEEFIKNVVSYDGHLFADRTTAQFVGDLVSALPVRLVQGQWFPTCQSTDLIAGPRAGLAYLNTQWDLDRYREILARLMQAADLRRYGAGATAEPSPSLPFDGVSVLSMLAGSAAALCLHTPQHRQIGTPSARSLEAAAAGAVIISDEHGFVRETFGDAALYVDVEASPQSVAEQIARQVAWIARNPEAAEQKRRIAHRIFSERFTLEMLLKQLPDLVADIRDAWRSPASMAGRPVTYIVRTGERDVRYLDRALTSLERQTHPNIHANVVTYCKAEAIGRYLASRRTGLAKLTVIESADTGLRSSALWVGLNSVNTEFYGILDDDDMLLPNHVAACLAALDAFPEVDVAFSGTIGVSEDDDVIEPRSPISFPHFDAENFRRRNDIYSNAWLARRCTLARAGEDPGFLVGEDYYLLLRLQRGANFTPTWRMTAEYRQRTKDLTHSPVATELDGYLERIKRRLHFARSPFRASSPIASLQVLANDDYMASRVIRRMIKRQYVRKGLQIYLTDVASWPARLRRLPSILRHGGMKELFRRIERRGAAEYGRRIGNR